MTVTFTEAEYSTDPAACVRAASADADGKVLVVRPDGSVRVVIDLCKRPLPIEPETHELVEAWTARVADLMAEIERMRPVYEAAKAWRRGVWLDASESRDPFVRAVDAALADETPLPEARVAEREQAIEIDRLTTDQAANRGALQHAVAQLAELLQLRDRVAELEAGCYHAVSSVTDGVRTCVYCHKVLPEVKP